MTTELVHLDVAGGVATATLDSPANRNALSGNLCAQLLAHLRTAIVDPGVRVIVLTHTGTVFCAGADLKESAEQKVRTASDFAAILDTLWTSPTPVIVRLDGTARAGGLGLVAASDFAVAATTVTFAFTEVRIGVIPAVISVPLRRKIITHQLERLFLTGETFDAPTAERIGLLTSAACPEAVVDAVAALAADLVRCAPEAWRATKELLRGADSSIASELSAMADLSRKYFASDEAREGIAALTERRTPAWVPADSI